MFRLDVTFPPVMLAGARGIEGGSWGWVRVWIWVGWGGVGVGGGGSYGRLCADGQTGRYTSDTHARVRTHTLSLFLCLSLSLSLSARIEHRLPHSQFATSIEVDDRVGNH